MAGWSLTKSDEHACSITLPSALISLQRRARRLGEDAAVDIGFTANDRDLEKSTEFRCAAGNVVVNVALTRRVVRIAR